MATGSGVGAIGVVANTANQAVKSVSDLSPLPKAPAPVNYLTWIVGTVPTIAAGISGLWGFFAGVFGVLFLVYAVLTFVASATNRVVAAPLLDFLTSVSDSVDDESETQLAGLATRREKVSFVLGLLGWWLARTLLSLVVGPMLFLVSVVVRDGPVIVMIALLANSWMFVTAHMKPFVRFATWTVDLGRATWNFVGGGINGINAISGRWLTQLYNVNVFYSIALVAALAGLFDAPAIVGRALQAEPLQTYSPTSSRQTRLDNGVPAQIPGVEDMAKRFEPVATGYTVITSGTYSLVIGTVEVLVPVVRPVFPVIRDNFPQISQVLGCAVTWTGAQCSVRQGIATVLDVVESGVEGFFSLVGVPVGDLNWSKGVKCSQSDAGNSIPCACSKESGGLFDGIEPCCAPTPSCRTDPISGQYFEMFEGCGQSYPGPSSPDQSLGCPNTWKSTGSGRRLRRVSDEDVAWQASVDAGGACVWYCESQSYVRLCPLAWSPAQQKLIVSPAPAPECAVVWDTDSGVRQDAAPEANRRRMRGQGKAALSAGASGAAGAATNATRARHRQKPSIAELVREQLRAEPTACAFAAVDDAAGRHAETACLFGVAKRASERAGLSGAPDIATLLPPLAAPDHARSDARHRALLQQRAFTETVGDVVHRLASHRVAALWDARQTKTKTQREEPEPEPARRRARRSLAQEVYETLPTLVRRRMAVAPDMLGNNFVESVAHIVRETTAPWLLERRVRESKRRLREQRVARANANANATATRRNLLLCASGRFSARTDCSCPYECPDGSCAESGAKCPYPQQWTIGVLYEWGLLQAELAVSQFDAVVFAGEVTRCWQTILANDERNPVSFQNAALTFDQRRQNSNLLWCWPMIPEWPFGSIHGSDFDLEVWIASRCTAAAENEEPCACSAYWGLHFEVDIMWMEGIPYFEPARYHDGLLAGWHLLTFVTRDTFVDHTWQFIWNPWYPAVPKWFAHLLGDQGQKGSAQEQLDCALFYFGSTLWVLVMIRLAALLFVTVGYLAIVRTMELLGIAETVLELSFVSFARSREFRRKAKRAIASVVRRVRNASPGGVTDAFNSAIRRMGRGRARNQRQLEE